MPDPVAGLGEPRKSLPDRHGYPSRRLRGAIRAESEWYAAWEEIATHARNAARRAKGNGDGAKVRAWQTIARVAAANRDSILVSRSVKTGRL